MSRSVYIVKGSEDGFLGVASNKKAACKIAAEKNYGFVDYRTLCEDLKEYTISFHEQLKDPNDPYDCDISVEIFEMELRSK